MCMYVFLNITYAFNCQFNSLSISHKSSSAYINAGINNCFKLCDKSLTWLVNISGVIRDFGEVKMLVCIN